MIHSRHIFIYIGEEVHHTPLLKKSSIIYVLQYRKTAYLCKSYNHDNIINNNGFHSSSHIEAFFIASDYTKICNKLKNRNQLNVLYKKLEFARWKS